MVALLLGAAGCLIVLVVFAGGAGLGYWVGSRDNPHRRKHTAEDADKEKENSKVPLREQWENMMNYQGGYGDEQ